MRFLEALRQYLLEVEQAPTLVTARVSPPTIDLPAAKHYFFTAVERVERSWDREQSPRLRAHTPSELSYWLSGRKLDRFLRFVVSELRSGLCANDDPRVLHENIERVIDVLLGEPTLGMTSIRSRELIRIAEEGLEDTKGFGDRHDVERYALEVRATRRLPSGASLSGIGRVLVGLPATDIVRWLLTLETAQSMGPTDTWRMSRGTLETILRVPANSFSVPEHFGHEDETLVKEELVDEEDRPWGFPDESLERLVDFGIVTSWTDRDPPTWGYTLRPEFRPMLEEIVSSSPTPLSTLAESLIAEERGTVSGHIPLSLAVGESATEIQARHARLVVHEIRNALVPVRMALAGLYRTLGERAPGEPWQSQQERIDRGIDRVFRFVSDLQQVARLGSTLAQPFDLVAAIQDAVNSLNGGLGVVPELEADGSLPRIQGSRERFTLAVVNLLRNAAQASEQPPARVRLRARVVAEGRTVVVTVEDNGPGVPEQDRERIFEQGVALRQGGSGQGLALVREVVQTEMKGTVRCESSELGGAQFVLELRVAAKES